MFQSPSASESALFDGPARYMRASSRRLLLSARTTKAGWLVRSAARMQIGATGVCRDQDHRRSLQSFFSGNLPRANRHHLGLRRRLDAVLPDGRAAACRLDEVPSGRASCGMALRDRQTGSQGSLRSKPPCAGEIACGAGLGCGNRFGCFDFAVRLIQILPADSSCRFLPQISPADCSR